MSALLLCKENDILFLILKSLKIFFENLSSIEIKLILLELLFNIFFFVYVY